MRQEHQAMQSEKKACKSMISFFTKNLLPVSLFFFFFFYTFTLNIDWDLAPAEEEVTAHAPCHQYRHASITTAVGNQCGKDPFFYFLCLQMHSDTHFKPTQNNFLLGVASYLIEIPPPPPPPRWYKFISKTFLYGDFIIYYLLIFNKLYFNF